MAAPQRQPCRPKPPACPTKSPPEPPLRVKVVGLFKSSSFQVSKTIAEVLCNFCRCFCSLTEPDASRILKMAQKCFEESIYVFVNMQNVIKHLKKNKSSQTLKNNYPTRFEDPVIIPLQEFAWDQYLQEKKRELKGDTWVYSSYVMCFVNDQFLGNAFDLKKWAQKVWDVVDVRPSALYEALTLNYATKFLKDTKHDFVYLDICIDLSPIGRLIFELYCDTCPKTCKNFQVLCTGMAGFSERGIKLHYKDSIFHRVVQNGWIQGGDIVEGKGDDGESIYGPTFEDENFSVPHDKRGVLGMVNKGRHTNGSQFYITLQATPYLDKKYVAFGQLIEGTEVLKELELVPTENERPMLLCSIADSGILYT